MTARKTPNTLRLEDFDSSIGIKSAETVVSVVNSPQKSLLSRRHSALDIGWGYDGISLSRKSSRAIYGLQPTLHRALRSGEGAAALLIKKARRVRPGLLKIVSPT